MKQFQGNIVRWEIHKLSAGRGAVVTGTIRDGSTKFEDGWHFRSSLIEKIQKADNFYVVETKNSIYHLHGPRGDDVFPFRGDIVLSLFY